MSFLTALIIGALITFGVKNTKEVKVEEKVAEVQVEAKKQEEVVKPVPETFKPTEQTVVAEPVQEKPAPVVEPAKPEPQEFKPTEQTVVAEQKPAEEVKPVEEKPAPEPEAAKSAEPEKEPEPAPIEEETSYLKYILYALGALVLAVVAKLMFSRKPAATETAQEEAPSFRRQADFEVETFEKQPEPEPELQPEPEPEPQPEPNPTEEDLSQQTEDKNEPEDKN